MTVTVAPVVGAVIATTGPVPTVTATAADVVCVPSEFVTTAVSDTAPAAVGVHARLKGAVVLVPIEVALARYCTLATEPTGVDVLEVSVVATLMGTFALALGDVIETVGESELLTVTEIAALVLMLPVASVARAVSEYVPAAVGVQLTLYGNVLAVPTETPFAKNCTVAIVLAAEVAVARSVVAELTVRVAPFVGAVTDTTGPVPTVTATAAEVVVTPIRSVTTAVSEAAPAAVGVHAKLNGDVVLVPSDVAPLKNCTLVGVPSGEEALTVIVVVALSATVDAAVGDVIETDGVTAVELTVTLFAELVVVLPTLSVARAVSA